MPIRVFCDHGFVGGQSLRRQRVLGMKKTAPKVRMNDGGLPSKAWLRFCCCLLASAIVGSAATERDAASWVVPQGGRVLLDGNRTPLRDLSELPLGEFHITGVDLTNTLIEPEKLEKISGLVGLRELDLPASMWTPFSDSPLDANESLKYLAGLKNIERL